MLKFAEFIGIDWSGSRDYSRGSDGEFPIQIATCSSETGRLELHQPVAVHNANWRDNRWSRTTAHRWLVDRIETQAKQESPLLIGFDFALSFPYADLGLYFPSEVPQTLNWQALLSLVRQNAAQDFDPNPFIAHNFYRRFFKLAQDQGSDYAARHCITERSDYVNNLTPANVFKLIGGDQVGRGSISGMAMIHDLREHFAEEVHVWPFDGVTPRSKARVVVVEIWPRMLYEMVGVPPNSHRYPLVFQLALQLCGVANVNELGPPAGENSGDALLTAAALRQFNQDASVWRAPERLAIEHFSLEGWIWGAQ